MNTKKGKVIINIIIVTAILVFALAVRDNIKIYNIKEENLLDNNIKAITTNMDVENEKDINLVKELKEDNAVIYLYKVDYKYAVLGYAQSAIYKNYKLVEENYLLFSNENKYAYIQTPKNYLTFEVSSKEGEENIKIYDTLKDNSKYFYLVLLIVILIVNYILLKRRRNGKQGN